MNSDKTLSFGQGIISFGIFRIQFVKNTRAHLSYWTRWSDTPPSIYALASNNLFYAPSKWYGRYGLTTQGIHKFLPGVSLLRPSPHFPFRDYQLLSCGGEFWHFSHQMCRKRVWDAYHFLVTCPGLGILLLYLFRYWYHPKMTKRLYPCVFPKLFWIYVETYSASSSILV